MLNKFTILQRGVDLESIIETLDELNIYSVAFRVLMALILGGLIGLERGRHGRAAGLRTHILVCVGAAMAALVGVYSVANLNPNSDPLRVGAQVISGIGFLGVGTILVRDRTRVTGLTTAAGLWATASIGLAIGIGFYLAAVMGFAAMLLTMTFLIHIEKKTKSKTPYHCYIECMDAEQVKTIYHALQPYATRINIIPARSGISSHIGLELEANGNSEYELLLQKAEENRSVLIALPLQN
jgi:putative Mg2+ transporter-C (MgtC) family protein